MPYGVPDYSNDFVHPDSRDLAEKLVLDGWPEMRRRYGGAGEQVLAMEARYKGAGARKTAANERTADARRAIDDLLTRFRLANQPSTDEDLRPLKDALSRAEVSEAAADAEVVAAGTAMTAARNVANKLTNALAEVAARGERLRPRKVNIRKGIPSEVLRANLSEQDEAKAAGKATQNAGQLVSVLKQQAIASLDSLLAERDPFRLSYAGGEVEFRWPVIAIPAEHKMPARVVTAPDPMPMFLALFGDEIKKRVLARIESDHHNDKSLRLSKEEKKARLAKLRARLLDLQYEEAALRVGLAGDAPEIAFRPEMDVMALLGAEVVR